MNRKGFTLIELLAVIVVLIIILLIAMPTVLNVIGDARKGALEATAIGIQKAVENEYMRKKMKNQDGYEEYQFIDGVLQDGKSLDHSGKPPENGIIIVDNNGKIEFVFQEDDWCTTKSFDSSTLQTNPFPEGFCELPSSDVFGNLNDGYPFLLMETEIILQETQTPSSPTDNGGLHDFAFGSGTLEDPYLVSTPQELTSVNNYTSSYFLQINDIDMTGYGSWEPIGRGNVSQWDNPFTGTYDGNYYSITNFAIDSEAMFFYVNGGEIKNIGIAGEFGLGTTSYNASLISYIDGGTIDNVHIFGTMEIKRNGFGNRNGGLIAEADSMTGPLTIENTTVNITMTGIATQYREYIGGLIGQLWGHDGGVTIRKVGVNIDLNNDVTETWNTGGLIGIFYSNSGTTLIDQVYVKGRVLGNDTIGGLIGWLENSTTLTISNSYVLADIYSDYYGAGIIGYADDFLNLINIENVYFSGSVDGSNNANFANNQTGPITNSYYDTSKSNLPSNGIGQGLSEEQMKSQTNYVGWNFTTIWGIN